MDQFGARMTAALAAAAGVAEAALAFMGEVPTWLLLPLALAAAGLLVWAALAIDVASRRRAAPSRAQVAEMLLLQRSQHDFNRAVWDRVRHDGIALRLTMLDADLHEIDPAIAAAARAMETVDGTSAQVGAWDAALDRWYAATALYCPSLITDRSPPQDAELRAARSRLPFGRNLSSADQKAVLHYLVTSDRLAADIAKLQAYRKNAVQAALDANLPITV